MPRNWEAVAQSTEGEYTVEDFQQALSQLVAQQCLYLRHQHQAVSYRMISRWRSEFREAVELMGSKLDFSERLNFCFVIQDKGRPQPMDLGETRFMLALRQIYHLRASAGDLTPEGDAVVGLPELQESYKTLTGRDLDTGRGALEPLMKAAKRQGLARMGEVDAGDAQPYSVVILPGIAEVLSEYALSRFGAALKASLPVDVQESEGTQA